MIDHMGFSVSDYERAKAFYTKALAPLGYSLIMEVTQEQTGHDPAAGFGADGKPDFWIGGEGGLNKPIHVAILARDRTSVDAFYRAARSAGGRRTKGCCSFRRRTTPRAGNGRARISAVRMARADVMIARKAE